MASKESTMAGQRYFIKVPRPVERGGEYEYVEVDVERLNPRVIRELWTRTTRGGRDAHSQFRPAHGAEALIGDALDVTELTALFDELVAQMRHALLAFGDAGDAIRKEIVDPLDLRPVFDALAKGHVRVARDALSGILYALMSGTASVAEALSQKEILASGLGAAVDAFDATVAVRDTLEGKLYFDWALAAETLNTTVTELTAHEREFRGILDEVTSGRDAWRKLLAEDHPTIRAALEFLDRSETSFVLTTFGWRRDPPPRADAEALIAQARTHIQACRGQADIVRKTYDGLHARLGASLAKKEDILARCATLSESQRRLRGLAARFPTNAARPYAVQDGKLISQEEYERAEQYLRDAQWAPLTAQQRLVGLLSSASTFMAQPPSLPREVVRVLEHAEGEIRVTEAEWAEAAPAPPPAPTDADEEDAEGVAELTPAPTGLDEDGATAITPARAEELYELVICVGYVLTCSSAHLAASTIHAMLKVVRYLGRCSELEALHSRGAVRALAYRASEVETVSETRNVNARWKQSQARWISYKPGRAAFASLKLARSAEEGALRLLAKHGITPTAIKDAHQRKREEQRRQWEAGRRA